MTSTRLRASKASTWLAGLVVGAVAGFWFAEWPTFGAVLAIAFALPAALSKARLPALGGLLVGMPAIWLTVIGAATARCADFGAQPGQECVMSDIGPWPFVAVGLLLVGTICSLAAARR